MHFNSGANERGCKVSCVNLTDRELMDIGITRGEIENVALNKLDLVGSPSLCLISA